MKESYERTLLTVTELQQEDIIATFGKEPTPVEPTDRYMIPIR